MRKIKEVLRLHAAGRSKREIAGNLAIWHSTVAEYLRRAELAGLSWPLPPELSDSALEARLFAPTAPAKVARPLPVWSEIQKELRGKGGSSVRQARTTPTSSRAPPQSGQAGSATGTRMGAEVISLASGRVR